MKSIKTFLFLIIVANYSFGQFQLRGSWRPRDTSTAHILITHQRDTLFGRMLRKNYDAIVFLSNYDTFYFEKSAVKLVDVSGRAFKDPPALTRKLLVSPTAFPLNKGEWEYRNLNIFYNGIHTGMCENFSIGSGLFTFFTLSALWADCKVSHNLGKYGAIAGGAFLGGIALYDKDDGNDKSETHPFGGVFMALSLGTERNYINFNTVHVPHNEHWYSLGGSCMISKEMRMFGEIGYDSAGWTPAIGISFLRKNKTFDIALVSIPDYSTSYKIPGLSYTVHY